jgi:hypothetical protein
MARIYRILLKYQNQSLKITVITNPGNHQISLIRDSKLDLSQDYLSFFNLVKTF